MILRSYCNLQDSDEVCIFFVGLFNVEILMHHNLPFLPPAKEGGIPACLQVSRPTPREELEGSGQGGVSRPTPRGSPGPYPGNSRPTPRVVYPNMHWNRPRPQLMATAAGGTHPTTDDLIFDCRIKWLKADSFENCIWIRTTQISELHNGRQFT